MLARVLLLASAAAAALAAQDPATKTPTKPAAQDAPGSAVPARAVSGGSRVAALLKEGDEFYAQRETDGKAHAALASYQKALALDETCVDAYWKIAKANYWLGSQETDDGKRAARFKEGIEYAKMGVAVDPANRDAHFWLGVSYGVYGQAVGVFQSLHMVEPIKTEMQWLLARDEGFEEGGAHRVLGRLYHKLPAFKGGDRKLAKEHLEKAIALGPTNTLNYLYLAELQMDEGDKAGARASLEKLLEQPDDPEYLPETKAQKAQARAHLERLPKAKS